MIKKFIKISGTGKFLNYSHSFVPAPHRTTDFEKINLLYGENGSGKTTLSLLFDALRDGSNLLGKKRSFDKTFPQTVEILTDVTPNPRITYANDAWDNNYPNIEIFDIHFINDNIYTGLEIQSSHKKNLFEVIFGVQGVQLKKDIQEIKEKIQACNKTIKTTATQIELAIDNAFPAADYCNRQKDPDIDTKFVSKESEIKTAKSYQQLQIKPTPSHIPTIDLPFDIGKAIKTVNHSIESISEKYLQKFNAHKDHIEMDGKEEEWIKQGYEAIKDKTCPFCLRPFDETTEIIDAYNQYFNQEYNDLLQSISELTTTTTAFNIAAQLLAVENKISSNQTLIEFWKVHVDNPPQLTSISGDMEGLKVAFEAVKTVVKEKSLNPIKAQPISDLTSFQDIIATLNEKLTAFNKEIETYNTRITALKSGDPPNILQLETDLKQLKAIKKRDDITISALCTKLLTNSTTVENLTTDKDAKQAELDTYSTTVFANYATKINQYLQTFAPYLEIRDFDSGYVGQSKEPIVKYALHIDGYEIKQEDSQSHPTFKYSLSEGDKSALAIAFFLTKLDLDGNLHDKIIVFDDPISSFDLNRKYTTINKLVSFGQLAKQLFVFTHNLIFASEFWKSVNQVPCSAQCSKIEYIGNTSCIVEYDIDTETLSSILKDSLRIKNYLSNGCLSDQERRSVARCLRPALESYFHLKFFDVVAPHDWLGDFVSKVRTATPTDPYYRLQNKFADLTDINDYSKKFHHRFNANNETETVIDAELRSYCQRTLDLIQVI